MNAIGLFCQKIFSYILLQIDMQSDVHSFSARFELLSMG